MSNVQIDMVGPNGGQGEIARALQANGGLNIGAMRPYIGKNGQTLITVYQGGDPKNKNSWKTLQVNDKGTLRRDEWRSLDQSLLGLAESRLTGTQYLINAGLTYTLGNAMGTTVLEYHNVGDAMVAELSMDAVTRTKSGKQEFESVFLPIPIIHVDYSINQRTLAASRSLGNPLDTTNAERAGRRVLEKQEDLLFSPNQDAYKFGGGTIYSFLNHPNRIQKNDLTDWASAVVTGEDIVDDVLEMKQESINKKHYGPWVIFIPTNFETKLDQDYSDAKNANTIRERILAINGVDDIVVVDTLPSSEVVMVQKSTDVVRIVQGLALQNIQWQTEGGFVNKFKVISIQVPQIRADQNGNTGLVHATVAST